MHDKDIVSWGTSSSINVELATLRRTDANICDNGVFEMVKEAMVSRIWHENQGSFESAIMKWRSKGKGLRRLDV